VRKGCVPHFPFNIGCAASAAAAAGAVVAFASVVFYVAEVGTSSACWRIFADTHDGHLFR